LPNKIYPDSIAESSTSTQKTCLVVSILLVCLFLLCGQLNGQLSSASITGLVHDSTGAVVPNATLVLRNSETAVERRGESNSSGNYLFRDVPPGTYTIQTTVAAFKTSVIAPFMLSVNQTATIDIVVELGSVQQTVTVEAQGTSVEASTSELGTVVGERVVHDLPLNGRNFSALLTLTPGASPLNVAQNSSGGNIKILPGASFSFPALNGQTNRSNLFLLDGLNDQQAEGSTYAFPPIIDSIQEFKVNSHNDEAQFGGVMGGTVNVVTKSGTNEYHGALWEFDRNAIFNARNIFTPTKVPFSQNQFGGTLGGPIRIPKIYNGKNRTFFYVGAEGFVYTTTSQVFYRVPSTAELAGDLSDVPTQLYNPFSTRPDPNKPGFFIRDPFVNNQISPSLIDKGAVAFAKAILPQPISISGSQGLLYNAIDDTPTNIHQEVYSVRVDQNFGAKDQGWFRYSGLLYDQTGSGGVKGLVSTLDYPTLNYGGSWVHTFNPTFIMQAQYGRTVVETNQRSQFSATGLNALYGFTGQLGGSYLSLPSLVPNVGVASYWSGGELYYPTPYSTDVHQYKASATKTLGKHSIGWGGEWNQSTRDAHTENSSVSFTGTPTGNPENTAQPGNALASFLISVPTAATWRNIHAGLGFGGTGDVYLQDQWKATDRLTLNIGLRYDLTVIPPAGNPSAVGEIGGGPEVGDMDYTNGTYIVQKLPPPCSVRGQAPCIPGDGTLPAHVVVAAGGKLLHNTTTNVGPRVGLAYRLGKNTALRSGFGIVYDNWAAVSQYALNAGSGSWPNIGQLQPSNINTPTPAQPTPNLRAEDPFATGAGLLPAANPYNQTGYFVDPYIKNPYSEQWNLDIQHQFGFDTTVSVGYVGSQSHRLDSGGLYNVARTPGPGTPSARAPWPYLIAANYDRSIGNGTYNALQVSVNRHFSHNLAYQIAYTWGKSIDEGDSGWFGVEGHSLQDPYNLKGSRSVSAFDVTNQLTINTVYELPFGKGEQFSTGNSVIDHIVGNWQTNAIFIARSGQPYNVTADGDIANTGNTAYMRANIVGNPKLSNRTPAEWFNTAAFAIPAPYTFGNLGRDAFRSEGYWNLDLSLIRRFPVRDRMGLEFRLEAFNALNTIIYGVPTADISVPLTFGHVTSAADNPRVLQLGVKFTF